MEGENTERSTEPKAPAANTVDAAASAAAAASDPAPSKRPSMLAYLTERIKAAEKAAAAEEHAALVSVHTHLAELKTKLDLLGHKVGADPKGLVDYLKSLL